MVQWYQNLPANAGDLGLIPGLGRFHMPQATKAHAPQILSLCSRAHEPQLLKPTHLEPVLSKGEACRLPTKSSPHSLQLEKTCTQQARPRETK